MILEISLIPPKQHFLVLKPFQSLFITSFETQVVPREQGNNTLKSSLVLTFFKVLPFVSCYYYSVVLTGSADFQVPLSTWSNLQARSIAVWAFLTPLPSITAVQCSLSVIQPYPHFLLQLSNAEVCSYVKFQ